MRKLIIATIVLLAIQTSSCSNDTKKDANTSDTTKVADKTEFPKIDTSNLKDEASIFKALNEVLEARAEEEKKSTQDPKFEKHYVEYATYYAAIINAATKYMDTFKDPLKSVEFNDKFSAIEKKYNIPK